MPSDVTTVQGWFSNSADAETIQSARAFLRITNPKAYSVWELWVAEFPPTPTQAWAWTLDALMLQGEVDLGNVDLIRSRLKDLGYGDLDDSPPTQGETQTWAQWATGTSALTGWSVRRVARYVALATDYEGYSPAPIMVEAVREDPGDIQVASYSTISSAYRRFGRMAESLGAVQAARISQSVATTTNAPAPTARVDATRTVEHSMTVVSENTPTLNPDRWGAGTYGAIALIGGLVVATVFAREAGKSGGAVLGARVGARINRTRRRSRRS